MAFYLPSCFLDSICPCHLEKRAPSYLEGRTGDEERRGDDGAGLNCSRHLPSPWVRHRSWSVRLITPGSNSMTEGLARHPLRRPADEFAATANTPRQTATAAHCRGEVAAGWTVTPMSVTPGSSLGPTARTRWSLATGTATTRRWDSPRPLSNTPSRRCGEALDEPALAQAHGQASLDQCRPDTPGSGSSAQPHAVGEGHIRASSREVAWLREWFRPRHRWNPRPGARSRQMSNPQSDGQGFSPPTPNSRIEQLSP